MSRSSTPRKFVLPPHANAEVHRRIMAELARMTPDELAQTVVDAGITTPDGQLTEHYRDPPPASARAVRGKRRRPLRRRTA